MLLKSSRICPANFRQLFSGGKFFIDRTDSALPPVSFKKIGRSVLSGHKINRKNALTFLHFALHDFFFSFEIGFAASLLLNFVGLLSHSCLYFLITVTLFKRI